MAQKTLTNYAVKNKGLAVIPLNNIFADNAIVSLNITAYTLPKITLQTADIVYKGVTISLPGKVIQPESKELTFDMIIDSEWKNYIQMNRWLYGIIKVNKQFKTDSTTVIAEDKSPDKSVFFKYSCPISVYALNEFKQPIAAFKYNNAYLFEIGEVTIDYKDDVEELHCSLSFKYTDLEIIEDNI